ncbi:MAG: glycosyltransferase family 9 protein [Myxococcota bacterium]
MAARIAVLRLGAVGDVVRTLPAARRIRAAYPEAHLAWLVEPAASGFLRAQGWIDEVIVFQRDSLATDLRSLNWVAFAREAARFVRELRDHRFDLVVDFHSIGRSGLLSFATGAGTRVAYGPPFGREFSYWCATARASLPRTKMSRFDRNAALADFLAIGPARSALPVEVRASSRFDRPPVALHPGTSAGAPHKRYPVASFGEVAREILAETGTRSIVTWGPGRDDRRLASEVVAASSGAADLAPPTPGLEDLAGLLSGCRLLIAGDSGPLHVASMVGTPVVQILGPTDPIENAPFAGTPSRVVTQPLGCSPCRRGCGAATCMRGIPTRQVLAAVFELLGVHSETAPVEVAGVF